MSATLLSLVLLILLSVFLLTAISTPGNGGIADTDTKAETIRLITDAGAASCPSGSEE